MIFDWRQSIGKSGERRVESFIEDELNFTYRKVGPPDIGIDGIIEIADLDRKSTGGMLAVQVKATSFSLYGKKSISLSLDEAHLDYFSSLVITPIIAIVSIADNKIWWKPLLHKDNYKSARSGYTIKFHRESDRLTKLSGQALTMLGNQSNAMIAGYLIDEAKDRLVEMDELYFSELYDSVTLDIWAQSIAYMMVTLREAHCLLRYERRYSNEISGIEKKYSIIMYEISEWKKRISEHGYGTLVDQHISAIDLD